MPYLVLVPESEAEYEVVWIYGYDVGVEPGAFSAGHYSGMAPLDAVLGPALLLKSASNSTGKQHHLTLVKPKMEIEDGHCYFGGLTEDKVYETLEFWKSRERRYVVRYLTSLPDTVLILEDPAEAGKTGLLEQIIHTLLVHRQRVLFTVATTQDLAQLSKPLAEYLEFDHWIIFQVWSESTERAFIKAYGEASKTITVTKHTKKSFKAGYTFEHSLASMVLRAAGILGTNNEKILVLQESYIELSSILHTQIGERTLEMWNTLDELIYAAFVDLICAADLIFCPAFVAPSKLIEVFIKKSDVLAVDEATYAKDMEMLTPWKGVSTKPLILIGDPQAVDAAVFSKFYGLLTGAGKHFASSHQQLALLMMHRLVLVNWPHDDLPSHRLFPPRQAQAAEALFHIRLTPAEQFASQKRKAAR